MSDWYEDYDQNYCRYCNRSPCEFGAHGDASAHDAVYAAHWDEHEESEEEYREAESEGRQTQAFRAMLHCGGNQQGAVRGSWHAILLIAETIGITAVIYPYREAIFAGEAAAVCLELEPDAEQLELGVYPLYGNGSWVELLERL